MERLKKKALSLGATEFGVSKCKNKRFYVIFNRKKINFGSTTNNTFIDHGDVQKRAGWRARHSKIKIKDGRYAYQVKEQSLYWAYKILW